MHLLTSQEFFNKKISDELAAHPDLQALEPGSSTKAPSEAPTTSNSTPAPTSNPLPKIKLVSNGVSISGSSSAHKADSEVNSAKHEED